MNKIVCLVGMCGSGKSVVADELIKNGFLFARFGQITLDLVKEKSLEPTEANERTIRENIRKEHGMGAFAILNLPKFNKLLEQGNLVADGLYSWTEYKILKKEYGNRMTVVAILTPPKLRYSRLTARTVIDEQMRNRPISESEAQARDVAEKVMKTVNEKAKDASIELAKEKGSFPLFKESKYYGKIKEIRNAERTTIAPNGTIGPLYNVNSSGEPFFSVVYDKKVRGGDFLSFVMPLFLKSSNFS